ncbi:hypothetical protein E3N88_21986 [Mikania micrantha]|uniref:Membrane protein of ER body-like protein n=1 Tax=Mikania micrantha TaxID=192012 RepID=A0A5N6NBP2_9ASTR|nr:hypothetical protein E3N88_21986 [Mikania micrantha]
MSVAVVEQWQAEVAEGAEAGLTHESGAFVEVVEPELVKPNLHCPNCGSETREVIVVGRKGVSYQPTMQPVDLVGSEPDPGQLVGCFSCLNFFACSDNGSLNPFDISPKRSETYIDRTSPSGDEQKEVHVGNGACYDDSLINIENKQGLRRSPSFGHACQPFASDPANCSDNEVGNGASYNDSMINIDENKHGLYRLPSFGHACQSVVSNPTNCSESELGMSRAPSYDDICNARAEMASATAPIYDEPSRGRSWLGYNGVLVEILKSIVYVGLIEVIASTSVVAFAAAFDANISSIIALAVASLIGGIFFIGHNLWDLRDDCYPEYLSQETNEQASNKYKRLLGQINYFPLHAFFAILSFVAFGMIPPIAYVLSFHETNDKNSTLLTVAIVSLLCILLLAMFKACINCYCSAFQFIKTAVYYATMVVIISSVSYVAGNLVTRLMVEFGLFETSSYGVMSHVTTSSLATY